MDQLQNVLLHILEIIDFQDDKQAFIEQITQICLGKTIIAVMKDISPEKQKLLQSMPGLQDKSVEEQMSYITRTTGLNKEIVEKKFLEISTRVLQEYIEAIIPTISQKQSQELQEYLKKVSFSM